MYIFRELCSFVLATASVPRVKVDFDRVISEHLWCAVQWADVANLVTLGVVAETWHVVWGDKITTSS